MIVKIPCWEQDDRLNELYRIQLREQCARQEFLRRYTLLTLSQTRLGFYVSAVQVF